MAYVWFGRADVALPGGCKIGARPVDLYVRGLTALGAVVDMSDEKIHVRAANGKGLVGGRFHLDYPSVGATETLMMAASMTEGVTVLTNVAWEPEVVDLAQFLNACGACIKGGGTNTLVITGTKKLHGAEFTIMPDRIEAGTFMVAAAITRSCISLSPVIPSHLTSLVEKLSEAGCKITEKGSQTLEVSVAYSFTVKELQKLGARIKTIGNSAFIEGKKPGSMPLRGAKVSAADLRGGAALVLAGLAADGITEVSGVSHIDRGYEGFEAKLRSLGAEIRRETDTEQ
ncbi:uncharacterized protein LOC109830084 [Asparagus officinalis]|uniref:uncharacterized protein LOC109830084 n=1 Tax=Asparagus officinalis TaxID=4686 RepID=UPI00098E610B|nr:uncharacterized protein LOC109830084 [Asparagus officinalis]